jgi:hypothetical protein
LEKLTRESTKEGTNPCHLNVLTSRTKHDSLYSVGLYKIVVERRLWLCIGVFNGVQSHFLVRLMLGGSMKMSCRRGM